MRAFRRHTTLRKHEEMSEDAPDIKAMFSFDDISSFESAHFVIPNNEPENQEELIDDAACKRYEIEKH